MKWRLVLAVAVLFPGVACRSKDRPLARPIGDARESIRIGDRNEGVVKSVGCVANGALGRRTVTVDGVLRRYRIVASLPFEPGVPHTVVFAFHGSGGNGDSFQRQMDLERHLKNALIIYPDAIERRVWANEFATHWGKVEDLPFVDAMDEEVSRAFCVDRSRIFAVGWSSGGYFANQLACARNDRFRAIASLSGGGPEAIQCSKAVPTLLYHDRGDSKVLYSTGRESLSAWRKTNGCSDSVRYWGDTDCLLFTECARAQPVVWCETEGEGHSVPPAIRDRVAAFVSSF